MDHEGQHLLDSQFQYAYLRFGPNTEKLAQVSKLVLSLLTQRFGLFFLLAWLREPDSAQQVDCFDLFFRLLCVGERNIEKNLKPSTQTLDGCSSMLSARLGAMSSGAKSGVMETGIDSCCALHRLCLSAGRVLFKVFQKRTGGRKNTFFRFEADDLGQRGPGHFWQGEWLGKSVSEMVDQGRRVVFENMATKTSSAVKRWKRVSKSRSSGARFA